MNKRIRKKKEIQDKFKVNISFSLISIDFKTEKERKSWVKYMTYNV